MLAACEKGSKSFKKECREKRDHEARSTGVVGGFNSDADRLGWQGQRTCAGLRGGQCKAKVRLADKISGMQQLSKMIGWNEPERVEVSGRALLTGIEKNSVHHGIMARNPSNGEFHVSLDLPFEILAVTEVGNLSAI